MKLRDYQQQGVDDIRQAFRAGFRAPLFVLPTGGGKTILFNYIAASAASKGKTVWILVHRIELIRQTSLKLMQAGVQHGIINPKFTPNYRANIQVASVQSLVKRMGRMFSKPDMIIVDEAHHTNATTYAKIIEANPQAKLLGVTATPCRTDESGLGVTSGGFFDHIVMGPQIYELIEQGHLSQPRILWPGTTGPDLSGVRSRAGDFARDQLQQVLDKPHITGNAVKHYRKVCAGEPAIVFCASVAHAQHVAEQFRAARYNFHAVDGKMDDQERTKLIEGLGNGSVQGLTSCDLISEGTDIPAVSCAILLRPTQSLGLYLQQVGRALRPAPGKKWAWVLDHVGNVTRHGVPDEHRDWSLDAPKRTKRGKKDKEPEMRAKQCPTCYAVHKPAPACPMCGHAYKPEGRQPDEVEGELKEMTKSDKEAMRRQRFKEQRSAQTLEDLIQLGKQRGYKPGWAYAVHKARMQKRGQRV